MNWISGETVFHEYLSGTLHEGTQVETHSVSLTASTMYRPEGPGDLDFGGGEFRLGERSEVSPEKRDPEDDYGWWSLTEGSWILELNENLTYSNPFSAVLQPHDHLAWNGAGHPTLWLTEDEADMRLLLPLSVPSAGLNIKENARVTNLKVSRASRT